MRLPSLAKLRRMTPDELHEELQVAAAHSDLDQWERCLGLWLDKTGWSVEELARYVAVKFREGLH